MIEPKDSDIYLVEEAMSHPDVAFLYNDVNDEALFNNIIRYIYWVYNPLSIYANQLPTERKKKVAKRFLGTEDFLSLEMRNGVKQVIDLYCDNVLSSAERLYAACKNDMEHEQNRMSSIPGEIEIRYDDNVEIEVPHGGSLIKKIVHVRTIIKKDNSDEKSKSYNAILKLFEYDRKMKEIVTAERVNSKIKQTRLFDKK